VKNCINCRIDCSGDFSRVIDLVDHCFGYTKLLTKKPGYLCDHCTFEVILDSQWGIGWEARAKFLFNDITHHCDNAADEEEKASAFKIYSAGISALALMCICCSSDIEAGGVPEEHMSHFNKKFFEKYRVPEKFYDSYPLLLCSKCERKEEKKIIKATPLMELPLHINTKWAWESSAAYFEKRLKNGE
jgi:hypothetical protein